MTGKVKCTCGWSWNKSDSSKKDMYICHECGRDNSNNMKNGGWLDNYNDSTTSAPEEMKGDGYSNVGRNSSPAWGGQFQMGGSVYPVNYVPQAQEGMKVPSRKDYKTQGQYNAALKTHKLNLHKHELASNPEKIKGESDKDYENRTKYFNFKVRQEENKNPVSKAYLEMKDNQNANPDAVTRTLRQIVTSPVHVGYGIYNAANLNNLDKYKSRATKNNEDLDLTNSLLDAASLLVPFDYGMKASPLWKQAATRTVKEVAEDEGFNLLKAGNKWINSFQSGGSLPGATGHMYARTGSPSKRPRRNQTDVTDASAQNGQEMKYYQEGLDWQPKTISQNGSYHTGDKVTYGTPEYREAYDRGEVVTEEGEHSPIALHEVIVRGKKKDKNWLEQYASKILEENKDAGPLGAIIGTPISAITSLPQLMLMKALTGKMERPSEGLDIKNPYGAMAVDAIADPANLIGVGELTALGKLTKEQALAKLAKIEASIAPELRQGLQTAGFTPDISKLNPWAFKSNPESYYRGIGEAGYKDAVNSGVFRQAGVDSGVPRYDKVYYGSGNKGFATAKNYSKNFIAELPDEAFDKTYIKPNWSSSNLSTTEHIPIDKGRILQKHWLQGYKEVPKPELHTPIKNSFIKRKQIFSDNKLPNYMEPYISQRVQPISREEEVFQNSLGRKAYNKNLEQRTINYDRDGNVLQEGGIIKDDRGQWGEHKGEPTRINQSGPGSYIDMGPDPLTGEPLTQVLIGISDKGERKIMYPGEKHKYKKGTKYVDEFPMAKNGLRQEQKGLQNLDNLTNFTNYNKPQPGSWLEKYN